MCFSTIFKASPHARSPTDIVPTLIILGGFFVIYKNWFDTLGQFDHNLKLWGTENIEISMKAWQCGGSVMINPCARVGKKYTSINDAVFLGGSGILVPNLATLIIISKGKRQEFRKLRACEFLQLLNKTFSWGP